MNMMSMAAAHFDGLYRLDFGLSAVLLLWNVCVCPTAFCTNFRCVFILL